MESSMAAALRRFTQQKLDEFVKKRRSQEGANEETGMQCE